MKVVFALVAIHLLPAAVAQADTTNAPSPAEIQGRQLARQLCEMPPAQNFTNTGVLEIRGPGDRHWQIPIRCEALATPTNWRAIYQATETNGMETLVVVHRPDQPNEYYETDSDQVPVRGGLAMRGHAYRGRRLSGAALMTPFAGSDFWICDLGLEFFHWPEQKISRHEMRRGRECDVLESVHPHPSANGYSRVVSWIDHETLGIVQAKAYDAKGRLLKEFYPKSFKKVRGHWEPQEMEIINDQTGSRTWMKLELKP